MKIVIVCFLMLIPGLRAQQPKPETAQQFECYVQAAEARMDARKAFLLSDSDIAAADQLVRGQKIRTTEANGPNPHKLPGGQLYDWIGSSFIPGVTLDRLVRMLQDYDHRAQYFPETISSSKLLCYSGTDRFQYTMRMKEPAVTDVESDVVWQRVDPQRMRCRSISTRIADVGKEKGYLRRLNSYWRFYETPKGVFVESETITMSDEFGSMSRFVGSAFLGINPEKSLRHSLNAMRESVLKPGLEIPKLPVGLPACGEPVPRASCTTGIGSR